MLRDLIFVSNISENRIAHIARAVIKHKFILLFLLASFFRGLEFSGVVLVPFFKDWGGLNQFQTQLLQSWFMLWIFFLEIPTGVMGDRIGVKSSTLIGLLTSGGAALICISTPDFYIFLFAEFLFATAAAFVSGSQEAWLYELVKEAGLSRMYTQLQVLSKNLYLLAMIVTSLTASFVSHFLGVRLMFSTIGVSAFIAFLFLLFVPRPKKDVNAELVPNYKRIIRESIKLLRKNKVLINDIAFVTVFSSLGYFVIWLQQTMMQDLGIPVTHFGWYRLIFLSAQIVLGFILARMLRDRRSSQRFDLLVAFLLSGAYIFAGLMHNTLGLIVYLAIVGGLGMQIRTIYSKQINEHIPTDKRATMLSMISMIHRITLVILNPLVGMLVDFQGISLAGWHFSGLYLSFLALGIMGFIALAYRLFSYLE